ncbi:heterotetrameric sarcosine oxidase alpha subunit [Paraburkholderia sp. BL23I1N1]|uniref:sarcosine oxidase subunit alpha family protein n=1 Tax=Paraburkholderia sp. BL23I1N1 TaxID=1938802 RepID=UPI000E714933|nr:sarcosine oxidase subunit alpha family protein [Paraburkholderia sp. BL23I1N1]RKE23831.1 heterotetrameric sarcosine oxidase alpha subunit [Paraburkholderia sp. BL23I1N1]
MKQRKRIAPYDAPAGVARKPLGFTFDGRHYVGLEGDTLASALLANGIDIVGRSFKLHRPRGVFSAGVEECNALVQLEAGGLDEPNARATLVMLYEGLRATSQNAWPSVRWDLLGLLDLFQRVLPASFYYKSMIWPNWHMYERVVRRIAGLGRAPTSRDAQTYQKRNLHCDVLICGGGPAGLSAALAAGQRGVRVVLVDDRDAPGGALLHEQMRINGESAGRWVERVVEQLRALPNVQLLTRTTVSGYYENNFLAAAERIAAPVRAQDRTGTLRERLWRIRASAVILATGALERPLVFPNNDRPGVMLAAAVRAYVNRFGVVCGQRVVIVTNHDDAYRTAIDLHEAGVRELSVVDTRANVDEKLQQCLHERGIAHYPAHGIVATQGRRKITAVRLARHLGGGQLGAAIVTLPCDLLAMSGGWTPTVHLFSQAGGKLRYDEANLCLVPDGCEQQVRVVGAANGKFTLAGCLADGARAGREMAEPSGGAHDLSTGAPVVDTGLDETLRIEPYWYTRGARTDKQWLDFQYDVKVSDVELALRENYVSVEHVKRYTTGGMSIDQGKSGNFNILAVMAELTGKPIPQVGTTRFRPPYQPVTLGTFAGPTVGERYAPWQTLPAHAWHAAQAAHFGDYGWRRPEYYPREDEGIATATLREVLAVRHGVGLFDGSPLGKIELKGPDAAAFLNRVYVNNLATLKPGFARYAMLSNDNGVLIDDGVIVRLADDDFLVHATSGAVARVFLLFEEYLQCEWPELRVHVTNVTTQWANVTVSGPKARQVLQKIESDIDFDADAFVHMQFRSGHFAGAPARILRASFTGEVTFEVSVPARYAQSLWQCISNAGAEFGITPYGIEALEVMRTEKGYLHIGSDTDGSSNALDIGWGKIIDKKTTDFIGRRSLQRAADCGDARLQFVGLESLVPDVPLPVGGHFIDEATPHMPVKSHGYVTAACISPMLGKAIGLGILRNGSARLGEQVHIYAKGKVTTARVVPPAHFDPQGERLHG